MAFRCVFLSIALLALPAHVFGQQPYNDWAKAYAEAEELVGSWTRYQVANVSVFDGTAPGHVPFTAKDGPMGLNGGRGVSGWIAAQTLAASWDPELIEKQYGAMAREFRSKGYSMQLGPVTGPMGRSPLGGRNFESFVIGEGSPDGTDRSSTNMDDRTLHELYLWPWVDGIANGLGSVMCVMNRVNGTGGCENDYTLNQVLKRKLGSKASFHLLRRMVIPDATAPINRTAALAHGLDWNSGLNLADISALIDDGTIPEEVMRDHAIRVVATQLNYNLPQDQYPNPATTVNLNRPLIRSAAAQSIVLLKNTAHALPLKNLTSISIFGLDAAQAVTGPAMVPNVYDYQGDTYAGHLASGGGSGATPMPFLVDPLTALAARAAAETFEVRHIASDNYTVLPSGSVKPGGGPLDSVSGFASGSQYCMVFLNAFAKEGADRLTLADETGDKLVNDVAGYCANTIVVLNNVGIRLVDAWIENPNVTAVLNAGALGQESGNAIMDVIFGDVNPSGKLVYTIAKKLEDYNGEICPCCECDYTEGLYTDYRHFDQAGIEPRYEFGGSEPLSAYTTGETADGGPADLFDELVTLTATLTNSGSVAGAEVAQLYLGFPESAKSPVRQLRGFQKTLLEPAETQTVSFTLQRRDVSIWDTVAQKWKIEAGTYTAQLGRSSRDIASEAEFQLATTGA
ncbi:hypothetical protein PG997_014290 [Apiospora hydei]|uniref:beta-glucosidase n=1 Tax=Apiospora hydei TaxID=1337664 RepID=A0ABR1UWK3_9PEZI